MGLLAEARAKNQARETEGIKPAQSVGLLAEARAIQGSQQQTDLPTFDVKQGDQPGFDRPEPTFGEQAVAAGETARTLATGATVGALGSIAGTLEQGAEEFRTGEFGTPAAAERISVAAKERAGGNIILPESELGKKRVKQVGELLAPLAAIPIVSAEAGAITQGVKAAAPAVRQAGQNVRRGARRAVSGAEETAEQAARRTTLQAEGLDPLRAQVTRDASEFQSQQELAKKSGPVRARQEQQEARLNTAFEQRAVDTQGNVVTSTSTPIDEVLERSIRIDEQVGTLYRQAREIAPNAQDIRLNRLAANLDRLAGEENISGGLISSVRNNLRARGILNENNQIAGRISVEVAEQIRQDINLLHNSVTDRGRQLSRQLKDSLDEDVFRQRGGDLFDRARTAKREFEQGLDRANISKFDNRKASLVRDMLDNKINPDTFINDVVFAKKWRSEDINQLRLYLNQTDSGRQAWNDLRAQTIIEIRDRSFKGPVRGDGVTQSLSRDALEKTLDKLGNKTEILFNADERAFFNRMREVSRLREPPPATFTGKGPSAQAIAQAKARFPIVGPLLDSLSEFRLSRLLLRLPRQAR